MVDKFGKNAQGLKDKKLYLFDMDGTIYIANDIIDGSLELLQEIENKGAKYVFITNNPSKSVKDYIKKVNGMGIKADESNFLTSAQVAIMLMKEKFGDSLIYAQGTKSFIEGLKDGGLNVTERFSDKAVAILVAFDTELTFAKMEETCKMLCQRDIPYYATNPDWCVNTSYGFVPDCGSMCFGYQKATGKTPIFIGKPQPEIVYSAIKKFGVGKADTVVIGDRVYTDIASGYNAGVDTICVLSGEATLQDIKESDIKPTYVFDSVKDIKL